LNVTWNTPNGQLPDFTRCFENTALVWAPSLFLLFAAPLDIYFILSSKVKHVARSPLSVAKYGLTLVLSVAQLLILYFTFALNDWDMQIIYPVEYVAPLQRLLTYVLIHLKGKSS
jgi:ATP-binding cassette subfamily C (CFTR/MRP) protein 1